MKYMKKSLDKIYSKYLGSWISVSDDYSKVYAHSKQFEGLISKLKRIKTKGGMIMRIPEQKYSAYVG